MTSRDLRQQEILDKIVKANYIGGIEAFTSFGKTRISLNIIASYNPKSLLIIVPSTPLQQDWINHLKNRKITGEVQIINTAYKNTNDYDMLVIDEAHRAPSPLWKTLFNNIKYNKLIWLTATVERQDGNHKILLEKAPIVDKVTKKECIKNGWTEAIKIVKVPIELTKEEKVQYNKLNIRFENIKLELGPGNSLKTANKVIAYLNLNNWYIKKSNNAIKFKSSLNKLFFNPDKSNLLKAKGYTIDLKGFNLFLKLNYIKPDKEHPLFKRALLGKDLFAVIVKRKDLLYNAHNKLSETLKLVDRHKDQYKFVIGQKIDFLEKIRKNLPKKETGIYHSKLKKKEKLHFFNKFKDGRTKIKTLISAKSLVEGIDIPKLEIVIVTSFTSSKITNIQLQGRLGRLYEDKKPIIYYLFCKGTIEEESWLKNLGI